MKVIENLSSSISFSVHRRPGCRRDAPFYTRIGSANFPLACFLGILCRSKASHEGLCLSQ